jgi:DNA-binding transcriptional ArsR family regulator
VSRRHSANLKYLDRETAGVVAETMQALSTPSRVRILSRLGAGACSVGELAREVSMEHSAVGAPRRSSFACCDISVSWSAPAEARA